MPFSKVFHKILCRVNYLSTIDSFKNFYEAFTLVEITAVKYCKKCNKELMPTMLLCPSCGNREFVEEPNISASSPTNATHDNANIQNSKQATHSGTNYSNPGTSNQTDHFVAAGHTARFFAAMIDVLIVSIAGSLISVLLVAFVGSSGTDGADLLYSVLGMVGGIAYYSVFHTSKYAATLGKQICSIKLVTKDGHTATLGVAIARAVLPTVILIGGSVVYGLLLAPFIILSEGSSLMQNGTITAGVIIFIALLFAPYLIIFKTQYRRSLFDIICNTRVVKK